MLYSLYDPLTSLFTNEDSREFILGVFSLLGNMEFDLKIRNASFLDETWELPVFKQIELVPSHDLGLTIRYVQGRAVVVDLDIHGVAAEDDKVQVSASKTCKFLLNKINLESDSSMTFFLWSLQTPLVGL